MLAAGLTVSVMAEELGVEELMVRQSLRRHRLSMVSEQWLRRRYLDDGATMEAMAEELGCTFATIFKAIHRAGIPSRPPGGAPRSPPATRRVAP
jgi:hypothetical protein